jgi:hypothetical protein
MGEFSETAFVKAAVCDPTEVNNISNANSGDLQVGVRLETVPFLVEVPSRSTAITPLTQLTWSQISSTHTPGDATKKFSLCN